jgi:hypothetical protein
VTTLPNQLALVGCLTGLLGARSPAVAVSFFPSVAGLLAWPMGRLLQN